MPEEIYYKTSPDDVFEKEIRIPFGTDLPYFLYGGSGGDCINCTIDDITPYDWTGHTLFIDVYTDQYSAPDEDPLLSIPVDDAFSQTEKGVTEGVNDIASKTIEWDDLSALDEGVEYWYRVRAQDADENDFTPVRGPFIKETK